MRALLVSNPTASTVTADRLRVVVRALESTFSLDVASTRDRLHAAELARDAVATGAKAVVVYGGDGTVNEVVNGMLGEDDSTDVVLGVLPGGGTNVLSRNLGYPDDLVEATGHLLDVAERASTRRVALGRVHAQRPHGPVVRTFVLGCGLGLDAETVRRVEASGLRPRLGDLAFLYCGTRAFMRIRRYGQPPLVLDTDDGPQSVWWASVANVDPYTYWGRRAIRVAPRAGFDRGLAVTAGRSVRWLRTMRWLRQALGAAAHVEDPECLAIADRAEVRIRACVPVPLQADGEYLGEALELRARSLPDALPVYA